MARMSYTPVPISLNRDERLISAAPALRLTYLCLRIGSDSWGRFQADPMALRLVSGILDPAVDVVALFDELIGLGMIQAWVGDDGRRYAEIVGYDDALTANMIRRRGESEIAKPDDSGRVSHESVTTESREEGESDGDAAAEPTHESVTTESREEGESDGDAAAEPTHESVTTESQDTLLSRARASRAEPSQAEPSQDTQRAGARETDKPPQPEPTLLSELEAGREPLSRPALAWLHRRVEVSKRNGYPMATLGEADDLCGAELRRLQGKPGFAEQVAKMTRLPDHRWGKKLSSGIAYLADMVANWIQPEKGNGRQAHFVAPPMTREEYKRKTGIDPTKAPVDTSDDARSVMEAIGAPA